MKTICLLFCFIFAHSSFAKEHSCQNQKEDIWIDHVAIGVPQLEQGVKLFTEMTGLKPQFGGRHENGVTGNYVLKIGACMYLEIFGRVADGTLPAYAKELDHIKEAKVFYYVLGTNYMDKLSAKLNSLGIQYNNIGTSSRTRPDGIVLNWRVIGFDVSQFGKLTPYVIDWLGSEHPAISSNGSDDTFALFSLVHPQAAALNEFLIKIGAKLRATKGSQKMSLTLNTPKGLLVIND